MVLAAVDAGGGATYPYHFVSAQHTQRVNNDGTFTPVVNITLQSVLYGVQFTYTILQTTWDNGGAPETEQTHTKWVDAVCAYPHVIGFHTEPDQGPDQIIYNWGVILVGPEGANTGIEVRQRMDHLGSGSTFAMIDRAWQQLEAAGAS